MSLILKLGVGLSEVVQRKVAVLTEFLKTWTDLSAAGANPRTWNQMESTTWNDLT